MKKSNYFGTARVLLASGLLLGLGSLVFEVIYWHYLGLVGLVFSALLITAGGILMRSRGDRTQ